MKVWKVKRVERNKVHFYEQTNVILRNMHVLSVIKMTKFHVCNHGSGDEVDEVDLIVSGRVRVTIFLIKSASFEK